MTCFIAQNELSAFADDALEAARAAELQAHLSGCSGCTRELQEIRRVRTMLRALPVQRAPVDFLAKVKAKAQQKSFLERAARALDPLLRLPRPAQAGLALAASLVIAITVFINPAIERGSLWDSAAAPGAAVSLSEVANVQSTPLALADDFAKRTNLDKNQNHEGELAADERKQKAGEKLDAIAGASAPPPQAVPGDLRQDAGRGSEEQLAKSGGRTASLPAATPARTSATPMGTPVASRAFGAGGSGSGATGNSTGNSGYVAPTNPGLYASTPQSIAAATPQPRPKVELVKPSSSNAPSKLATEADAREPAYETSAAFSEPSMDSSVSESAPSAGDDFLGAGLGTKGSSSSDRAEEKSAKARDSKDKDAVAKKELRRAGKESEAAPVGGVSRGADAAGAPIEAEMPVVATGSVSTATAAPAPASDPSVSVAVTTLSAKYLSAASSAPQDVVAAAKAVGGKLVSPANTPPGLGKAGASTVVIVEIPAAGIANFEAALRDAGTLERGTLPSGAVRYRIEVVRQ